MKERILTIRLLEKVREHPDYAETIGIEIRCGSDESGHASDSNSQQL